MSDAHGQQLIDLGMTGEEFIRRAGAYITERAMQHLAGPELAERLTAATTEAELDAIMQEAVNTATAELDALRESDPAEFVRRIQTGREH